MPHHRGIRQHPGRNHGKALPPTKYYFDKVHFDIVFVDTISKPSFRYAVLLINPATKYLWFYSVRSLVSAASNIEALEQFRADAGALPKQFRCDCEQKAPRG